MNGQRLEQKRKRRLAARETAIEKTEAGNDQKDEGATENKVDILEFDARILGVDISLCESIILISYDCSSFLHNGWTKRTESAMIGENVSVISRLSTKIYCFNCASKGWRKRTWQRLAIRGIVSNK